MAEATPHKKSLIDCFVCCEANLRCIKIKGRKATEEHFLDKFRVMLDCELDFINVCGSNDASVCRSCYKKFEQAYDFIVLLRNSSNRYASQAGKNVRSKRGIISPVTPKSTVSSLTTSTNKSRKQLKLTPPGPCNELPSVSTPTPQSTIEPSVQIPEDHGYCKGLQESVKSNENPLVARMKDLLDEATNGDAIFHSLRMQSSTLTSRTTSFCSVLYKYREIEKLEGAADVLLDEIVEEMINRVPLLLKAMLCIATPSNGKINQTIIPALASAYSILMKHKYNNLSAYHRLATIIAIRGGLDERAQTRLNHLGLMLSWTSRVSLQEGIQKMNETLIANNLKHNPLVKITGDNLDVYVKTSNLTKDRRNKDLHLFASNILFSRVSTMDMSNATPKVDVAGLNFDKVLMHEDSAEKAKLLHSYIVLLARILCKMPAFHRYGKLVPKHIPHEFSEKMSRKSVVHPLPIMFKNETKHEDCMAIMDGYEQQLSSLYSSAFGNIDFLRKFGVPVGGDQLTRVRLSEAKNLRSLSSSPEKRYDDLRPIVCEMWHTKQDLLEKCYKKLFKNEQSPGTLNFFKSILHRTDVNGKVKGRFQPHFDLLMSVGEEMVSEQFLEFFEMEDKESQPKHSLFVDLNKKSPAEQYDVLTKVLHEFVIHYGYGTVDGPKESRNQSEKHDELFNYCMQLCHWFLHISALHDTAKEGDLNRTIVNCQYSLPFFYSHSKLSKYLVENIDYVLKCKYLLSPLQKMRVLEGSYVNAKGGKGQNVESDLTQEHSVGNQKVLIKSLVPNKSEKAICRVTGAADTIAAICAKFDDCTDIKPKSGHHAKPLTESDQVLISERLRRIRPFNVTAGRKCLGFSNISSMPVSANQIPCMKQRFDTIISRLTRGLNITVEDDEDDEDF